MNSIEQLLKPAGDWRGSNELWLPPAEAPSESQATAQPAPVARGRFVKLSHTWAFDGETHEGLLLCGYEAAGQVATVAWP